MARRSPPRKVTYFEPVPPRLARNTIIELNRTDDQRGLEASLCGTGV